VFGQAGEALDDALDDRHQVSDVQPDLVLVTGYDCPAAPSAVVSGMVMTRAERRA
jgi:hypothetical protein